MTVSRRSSNTKTVQKNREILQSSYRKNTRHKMGNKGGKRKGKGKGKNNGDVITVKANKELPGYILQLPFPSFFEAILIPLQE